MHHKVFPAELDSLYAMLEFIKDYERTYNIPSPISDHMILAAEEALVNIINYGYPTEKKGTIEIICEKTKPRAGIKIVIKDQGVPFNPIEKFPQAPPSSSTVINKSENSLGGYGIYILIGLMDKVEYKRLKEGNMLSLIKYLENQAE